AGDRAVDRRDVEVVAGSPGDWTRAAADDGLAFRVTQERRPLSLIPLNRLFGQRFAVYWRVKGACLGLTRRGSRGRPTGPRVFLRAGPGPEALPGRGTRGRAWARPPGATWTGAGGCGLAPRDEG